MDALSRGSAVPGAMAWALRGSRGRGDADDAWALVVRQSGGNPACRSMRAVLVPPATEIGQPRGGMSVAVSGILNMAERWTMTVTYKLMRLSVIVGIVLMTPAWLRAQ